MVFISYSRKDKEIVYPLVKILKSSGIDVFVDLESIEFGDKWKLKTMNAIKESSRMIIFWSKNSSKSENIKVEWEAALRKQNYRIIPVFLDRTPLPFELSEFHGSFEFEAIFRKLKIVRNFKRFAGVVMLFLFVASMFFLTLSEPSKTVDISILTRLIEYGIVLIVLSPIFLFFGAFYQQHRYQKHLKSLVLAS